MTSERGRRARPLVLLLSLAAGLALSSRARADDPGDDHGAVQALITDAVAEYDAGHFEEARALFRRAQVDAPSARTLRGIGMTSFELRDYVGSTRALAAALEETRHPLTPEQRRHVEGLLGRAQTFVGRFALKLAPPDATLLVDGKPAEREPDGSLLLPFGRHLVVASCPGCVAAERALEVRGGEREEIALAATSHAADSIPVLRKSPGAGGEAGGGGGGGARAYALGAVALAAAGGAVAAGFWWHDRARELELCHAAGARCLNEPTVSRENRLATVTTVGVGAVAVTAGMLAAIFWGRREPGAAAHAMACMPAGEGLACAFRF